MKIQVKKFGITLVSRPSGKEAWLAYQPTLNEIPPGENIIVDFEGVIVLTPSWADEFLTPLRKKYQDRVFLLNTTNASVKATLEILEKN